MEKAVSKRSFDTGPCRVVVAGTHHMRDRRITEMSVVVLGNGKFTRRKGIQDSGSVHMSF